MKYAQYDKQGNIIGYSTDKRDNMVEIPQELQSDTLHKEYVIVNEEFVLKSEAPDVIENTIVVRGTQPTDVEAHKRYCIRDVNAGYERNMVLTSNKDYIYKAKEDEANAYLNDSAPVIDDYPFIKYESEVRGITPTETANLFKAKAKVAKEQLAIVESRRQSKIIAINAATTIDEVEAAYRG